MRRIAAILCVSLAACRHRPYLLETQGRTQILTPPPSKPEIRNARANPTQKTGCDAASESFSLTWRGNTARVTAKPEIYYAPPETQPEQPVPQPIAIRESGPRMYADSLAEIEKFRESIASKQDAGCFSSSEAVRLRQSIAESFSFPPQIVAFLRYGTYTQTGSFDLAPEFILRVVSPTGSTPDISFYNVAPVPGSDRVRIALSSGAGSALTIPAAPAYFRYLYWTGASVHNFRATILGAPEKTLLRDATRGFLADPDGYCAKPASGVFCQSIAASVGMNAGFNVRIDGKDVFARIGGTVGEAVGENAGRARTLPRIQSVKRIYRGKLIPVHFKNKEILSLVLMPGDQIVTT